MPPTPQVKPLPYRHRRLVFLLSLVVFLIAVPTFVFYAVGYRLDFLGELRNIRAVGGMYISAEASDIAIYVDDEPVENMRIFQNAAYIQNLDAGLHQVHVQGDDVATWVKLLPVHAHFVTEGSSFNMPVRPQVRFITPYVTSGGATVIQPDATTTFAFASNTNLFYATTSRATSTLVTNSEFTYVSSLFASSTEERQLLQQIKNYKPQRFSFENPIMPPATTSATTTVVTRDMMLYEFENDVFAKWIGNDNDRPYYFCLTYNGPKATSLAYGTHVYDQLVAELSTSTDMLDQTLLNQQLCRDTVKIDRLRQTVQWFGFLPSSSNHVLMHLDDGLYVVEIDDRAWQNTQMLYPGTELIVVVDGGQIYIKDGAQFLEVFTELQT